MEAWCGLQVETRKNRDRLKPHSLRLSSFEHIICYSDDIFFFIASRNQHEEQIQSLLAFSTGEGPVIKTPSRSPPSTTPSPIWTGDNIEQVDDYEEEIIGGNGQYIPDPFQQEESKKTLYLC